MSRRSHRKRLLGEPDAARLLRHEPSRVPRVEPKAQQPPADERLQIPSTVLFLHHPALVSNHFGMSAERRWSDVVRGGVPFRHEKYDRFPTALNAARDFGLVSTQ
jgi:hypothetical protein